MPRGYQTLVEATSVTTRFSLELFDLFIMCVYLCLYVINCLCVYFVRD